MTPPTLTLLEGRIPLRRHEHVALFFRGRRDSGRGASFLADGLARGEVCHYLAPRELHGALEDSLRSQSPECGAIRLRCSAGLADSTSLAEYSQRVFEDAEQAAAPALRWLEETSWRETAGFPAPQFFEFHARLNYQVKLFPSVALCLFALDALPSADLLAAVAVHRHLIVDGTLVRDNPFYLPPEKFIPLAPEERTSELSRLLCDVGFNVEKFLAAIAGYGQLASTL